jgi:hypothetical protein
MRGAKCLNSTANRAAIARLGHGPDQLDHFLA